MSQTTTAPLSYVEASRPARVAALMWVAEHAGILADGYAVAVTNTYDSATGRDVGEVSVQGKPGALQSLVIRLGAVPVVGETARDEYRDWVATEDGVRVRLVEERGPR